jgi:antitoxin (DNA-binding transcriptional repressor) of toxin-antitoxin stability system
MASKTISAKELRATLPKIVDRIRRGDQYTVIYRSRPAFRLIAVTPESGAVGRVDEDPLFQAPALGRTSDGRSSADHDEILYGKR